MNIQELRREDFVVWLKEHQTTKFEAHRMSSCPLAVWLSEVTNLPWKVGGLSCYQCTGMSFTNGTPTPDWMSKLVRELGRGFDRGSKVTGQQALGVLEVGS